MLSERALAVTGAQQARQRQSILKELDAIDALMATLRREVELGGLVGNAYAEVLSTHAARLGRFVAAHSATALTIHLLNGTDSE